MTSKAMDNEDAWSWMGRMIGEPEQGKLEDEDFAARHSVRRTT